MRLRNVQGSREKIDGSVFCLDDPKEYKGRWREFFGNDRPIYIEIGMGKGRFLMDMAAAHPENNYIGIEMYSSVLVRAVEKAEEAEKNESAGDNFIFLRFDATYLTDIFGEAEVDGIFLNFSDPWPKDRHAKRRLTSERFLKRYTAVLKKGGCVEFKTDNTALFDWSVNEFTENGWTLTVCTHDLHADRTLMNGNIMTEYEEKFSLTGAKICKLSAKRPPLS